MRKKLGVYKKRFSRASGIIWSIPPAKVPEDPLKSVHFTALKLLGRAKFLFMSILDEDRKNNAYASYVLTRAFFETSMTVGYLTIRILKNSETKDWEKIWQISHKIAQGGKRFPSDEYLAEVGQQRVEAINVYDSIDEVDKDISRGRTESQTKTPHREVYDTALSEFGHPNHLGLNISSSLFNSRTGVRLGKIDLDRGGLLVDRKNYLNHLDWASLIFFHYWDKLVRFLKKEGLNLPPLR